MGTAIAMVLPYVIIIQVIWTLLVVGWQELGIPWGF
jgi:p-aminobenzoyl-glutamate transporter AbgT